MAEATVPIINVSKAEYTLCLPVTLPFTAPTPMKAIAVSTIEISNLYVSILDENVAKTM
jgi:hypothetical protein